MFSRKRRGRFPRLLWCVLFLPTNFTFHSPFLLPRSLSLPPSFLSFAPVGALRPAALGLGSGASERASWASAGKLPHLSTPNTAKRRRCGEEARADKDAAYTRHGEWRKTRGWLANEQE